MTFGTFDHCIEDKTNNDDDRLFFLDQYTEGQSRVLVRSCIHMKPKRAYSKAIDITMSTPWLRLEILSIKTMNRIGDKGQPWRSPTLTGNESDLLLAMRTKLWHRS